MTDFRCTYRLQLTEQFGFRPVRDLAVPYVAELGASHLYLSPSLQARRGSTHGYDVDGLRIDHPDGLANPREYLERLRDRGARHVWVEKILEPGEPLRDWPVEGTTGYEFANDVTALFVDPAGEEPLTELYAELTGERRHFAEIAD